MPQNRSSEVIKQVAKDRQAVIRLEREKELVAANLKVAKKQLETSLADLAEYALDQLAFDLDAT
jgi:hypothetical protein